MTAADLPTAAAETLREGWFADRREVGIGLELDPAGALVAESYGRWVGMASAAAYRSSGWIGNLIVPPEERGRGVGSALMRRAIAHLEDAGAAEVRLDADPPGEGLYRRLGFVPEQRSLRFHLGEGVPTSRYVPPPAIALEPLTGEEIASVAELDRVAFGDDRRDLLELLADRSVWARRAVRDGRVAGYAMVRLAERAALLGPAVADGPDVARALLAAASAEAAARRRPVVLGVLEGSTTAREWVAATGWSERGSSLRMVRGGERFAGRPELVLAITNGALG